jgi:hypothetical protein
MTQQEVEAKKAALESNIAQLICKFEAETTSLVASLDCKKDALAGSIQEGILKMKFKSKVKVNAIRIT